MNSTLFALAVFDGIAYAAMVFMVAVGLTLIFGVLRVLNVAHGSFYAIGAYLTASIGLFLIAAGAPGWIAFPIMLIAACIIGIVVGGPVERLLLRRIYGKEEALQLLVTFAVFMILEDVQRLIWGVSPLWQSSASDMLGVIELFGVKYSSYQLILMPVMAIAVMLGLRYFLRFTHTGRLILAVTEDREAARRSGLPADLYHWRCTCRLWRCNAFLVHVSSTRHGRQYDRIEFCGRSHRGSGSDRGSHRRRAVNRPWPQLCCVSCTGTCRSDAVSDHAAGIAGST